MKLVFCDVEESLPLVEKDDKVRIIILPTAKNDVSQAITVHIVSKGHKPIG